MPAPISPKIHAVTAFSQKPEDYTFREATEWWKVVAKIIVDIGPLQQMDVNFINKRWLILTNALAEREGIPETLVSYMLGELALGEIQAAEAALLSVEEAFPKEDSDAEAASN